VAWCEVVLFGRDGEPHTSIVKADSLFEAAAVATQNNAKLHWYNGDADVVIRPLQPKAEYRVQKQKLRAWIAKNEFPYGKKWTKLYGR
jgi:hypothetical protein